MIRLIHPFDAELVGLHSLARRWLDWEAVYRGQRPSLEMRLQILLGAPVKPKAPKELTGELPWPKERAWR